MDSNDIKKRWTQSWEAKQEELDRIEKGYLWLYEFERHLIRGEEGNEVYRFPEIMGYVIRRYNEYLKVLPEARATGSGDGAIGLQSAIDHHKTTSNLDSVKMAAIADATAFGSGALCLLPQTWKRKFKDGTEGTSYSGLAAEKVDWRHLFPAAGFKQLHDHTGLNACPYTFRRKIYHWDSFKKTAELKGWKNIDQVKPTTWDDSNVWGDTSWVTTHESEESSTSSEFVTVLEYWDIINDELRMFATGGIDIFESKEGIPLSHKQLPFHQYRNIHRLDSINGIGEICLNMPYNLFREKIFNLAIDDIMLQVQPALVVDGEIGFNAEEQELESGAIFTVRGPSGGKLADHIMPLRAGGGVSQGVMSVIQMVENSRITVTSDDTTALYANPNQLATQTLAKMQSLNKSIDGATKRNIYDTEFYLVNQMTSLIKNELAEPYKDGKETKYHQVKIKGYDVVQEKDDSKVEFKQGFGASGQFSLNESVAKMFDEHEIEVVPAQKDEELKRDQTEKLTMMISSIFQTIGTLAQVDTNLVKDILGDMNVPELVKVQFRNLGLDNELKDIFPTIARKGYELDAINAEHEQIMMGILPPLRPDEDSMEEVKSHIKFKESAFFKKYASKKAKDLLNKHINNTLENAQLQNAIPVADRKNGVEGTQSVGGVNPVQANAQMVGRKATPVGATPPVPSPQGQVERGVSSGSALAGKGLR